MKSLIIFLLFISFAQTQQKSFSEAALNEKFLSENNVEINFSEILQQYKGKTVFIDIWASWCKDCIVGMPKVQKLREENPEVVFLFLSLDKEIESWKHGIEKYGVVGENYFIPAGWKGDFCSSIDLDWIPRYMVVNPEGEISLYKAIETNDENLLKALK
ncbi:MULTISPECIES: TlpA family protein disulfide reductase [Aequorivita]|uniref:TlpA family protein disulfide reductase n=1 Tax=Aequorivita iocasae TaxID=2803865 RepID=A0ABX7DS34_9FLAO|nr:MULTISPECIES: TlpA disulfide reductase family protein [Aequorivita]QQX76904.1 TlpA family protein disulfide reductase [Aequorivita iocasae]UCA56380.1 TlpA family protein disulfide reductase [Aequorivita sp. F7]